MRKLLMSAVLLGASLPVMANAYQGEATVSYTDINPDAGAGDSAIGVQAYYAFDAIDTSGLPLAEADFLRHASNVNANYLSVDKADADTVGVGAEFFLDQLYLSASIDQTSIGSADMDQYSAAIGFMPMSQLLLTIGVDKTELTGADDTNDLVLSLKYVNQMEGNTALNLEVDVTQNDDATDSMEYDVLVDYFFNPEMSAGVRISESDVSGDETDFGVGARMFFQPNLSAAIEFVTEKDTGDMITVFGSYRF